MSKWVWEGFDASKTSLSGDVSKLFRNEPVKLPGVFEIDAPSDNAVVMAREVIQNSWDAAIEAQDMANNGPPPPDFDLQFDFRLASGSDKHKLVEALALRELAQRVSDYENQRSQGDRSQSLRKDLGLPDECCLDQLTDDIDLPYLVITEAGTTGMYGRWGTDKSRLYLALASLGYTPKVGGGGSYGYGKAGLISGSGIRTVIAYTCFHARDDDPEVTRRLLGMTYWGQHSIPPDNYLGFARFGERETGGIVAPYVNEEADKVAESLGLELRHPEGRNGPGTTFLVVAPTVKPQDLLRAIERYWWPALEDQSVEFAVSIREAAGQVLHPKPKRNETLRSFIEAYEMATVPQDNPHPNKRRHPMRSVDNLPAPGTLGLVANPDSWSFPHQTNTDPDVDHRSLVALMRHPRMVVEYYVAGRTQPFVRGAFMAADDDAVDKALRLTEPKAHDAWQPRPGSDAGDNEASQAHRLAESVLRRIKQEVRKFRDSLKDPPRPQEQMRLPDFDRLMSRLMSGQTGGQPGPPPTPRDVSISSTPMAERVDDRRVRVTGQAQFALSDNFEGDHAMAKVLIRYRFDEDGRSGDAIPLEISLPPGFETTDNPDIFRGVLHHNVPAVFEYSSEPHPAIWTGKVYAEAELISQEDQ